MYKYKVLRENLHVDWFFQKPILNWVQVPSRFFEMLYEQFRDLLNPQLAEMSVNASAVIMSEVRAIYRIYGGNSTATLHSDRLNLSVPGAQPFELALVNQIMAGLHDAFKSKFPEIETGRIEVASYGHLDLGDVAAVNEFLNRFSIPKNEASLAVPPVLLRPSVRYTAIAEGGEWQGTVQAEHSIQSSTAIFVSMNMSFFKMPPELPFVEKAAVVQSATARCLRMIDLEIDHGAQA
jgi:hypothetical protein